MALDVHLVTPNEAYANCGAVVIREIVDAPTGFADIEACHRYISRTLEHFPAAGLLVVIHHGAPMLDWDARRQVVLRFSEFGERLTTVTCMLGIGFWANMASTATRSVTKLLSNTPLLVENSVEAGTKRLAMELLGIDPEQLLQAHEQLVAKIAACNNDGHPQRPGR